MSMSASLVLAVDDDHGILKLVELALNSANFEVLAFDNGFDALDTLKSGLHPDVIVSDVSMPVMDGFSFYEKVREIQELRGVPFLFLTALGERENIRYGMSIGADDYVTKPFKSDELVQAVKVRLQRVEELRRPLEGSIKITGLGHPLVEKNGERLDWDSLKALELLFYLLEHRNGVSTFEVAEALWPGKTESKASSSFHTTLYRLRKVMGGEIVESANRRYYLHSKFDIQYDTDLYRQATAKARESGQLKDYIEAADLYNGSFLTGFDSGWVEDIRLNLHAEHLTFLLATAERAEAEGNLETAAHFYQIMTEHEPYSKSAWVGLAKIWEARGEQGKAAATRERYEQLMKEL